MKLSDLQYDTFSKIVFIQLKEYAKASKDKYAVNLYKVVKKRMSRPKKRYELYRLRVSKRLNDKLNKQMMSDFLTKGMVITMTNYNGNEVKVIDL